ncbi:MAG TPA: DUF3352 domain-containing protein [Pirellulaceae bacterium]|nr:DUF3352 domain-containing protein [Pirellulaceae bacterium]HMO94358.1 DUF3352 domain-containing protein [Pirellulaceae bacterium]HMP70394.1 DUF3352 domain-containing protein [Pirellulaceae bacterium]
MFENKLLSAAIFAVLSYGLLVNASLNAQNRPPADELLPHDTIAYVQIPDVKALREDFANSGVGHIFGDERVQPLIDRLYEELAYLFESNVQDYVGVGLTDLLNVPSGELCFAVVAPKRQKTSFVFLLDIDEESGAAETLIERGIEAVERQGGQVKQDSSQDFEIRIFRNGEDEEVFFVRNSGTILACTDRNVLDQMLLRWTRTPIPKDLRLKDNRKYITIMNRCASVVEGKRHQFSFYVDPFEGISAALRGEAQRLLVLGILRTAGLDGLLAIGGTALFDELGYESIMHLHVSLSNPRKGVFRILALKPGKDDPELWVPEDTISYITSNWNVDDVYQQLQEIYHSYEPELQWPELISRNINEPLGIDFERDLVNALNGRLTMATWYEPPIRLNSQSNIIALGLKDPKEFEDILNQAIDRLSENLPISDSLEIIEYKGIEIWRAKVDEERLERRRASRDENGIRIDIRNPQPSLAIIGNSLVITESSVFLEKAIDTFRGESKRLAEHEGYNQVMREMSRLLKTDLPGLTLFSRPDLQFRNLFELADNESIRDFLRTQAEEYDFAGGIYDAMEDNPLPEFEELAGYLAPTGAFLTNDETGWHLMFFQLKSDKLK